MHTHYIKDPDGELTDLVPFCSDACHQQWCADNGQPYGGWNGCQEEGDSREYCASCGVYCGGGTGENKPCDCLYRNAVVNRFLSADGEKCACGNWIQLPAAWLNMTVS